MCSSTQTQRSLLAWVTAVLLMAGHTSSPVGAQNAFWSLQGEFQNATDSIELYLQWNYPVSSSDIFYGGTWGHSGTLSNAVGDPIAVGGFDPILKLFEVLGPGAEILRGENDDGYTAPGNFDSLLTWPAFSQNGGTINTDPLLAGDYRMGLTAYETGYPGGVSAWAMDLLGPWDPVSITGMASTGGASIQSLKFGSQSGGAAIFRLDATYSPTPAVTITDELVVGASGQGQLYLYAGATLTTPGGSVIGAGGTGIVTISGAGAVWNANYLTIGDPAGGAGSLVIGSQGRLNSGEASVGAFNGTGSVLIDGFVPGIGLPATWDVTGSMSVGTSGFGSGVVDVAQGGRLNVSDDITVGGSMDTTGRLTVQSNAQITVADTLFVEPNGTVELLDSEIHTGSFIVDPNGTFTHDDGTLIVDGGQFTMELGTLTIAGAPGGGMPTLRLDNGAQGSVERNLGVTPALDAGTIYVGTGRIVGMYGRGRLEIVGDSHVISSRGDIARFNTSQGIDQGVVLVQGSGSTWELTAEASVAESVWATTLSVGGHGAGRLEIRDGAHVIVQQGNAQFGDRMESSGPSTPGSGIGIVDGPGSRLIVNGSNNFGGSLGIGTSDPATGVSGALTVSNGARVDVMDVLFVGANGSLHLTSGGQAHTGSFNVDSAGTFNHDDGTLTVDGGTFDPGTAGYTISGVAASDEPTLELINGATASFTDTVQIGATGDAALRVIGDDGSGTASRFEAAGGIMDIGWIASGRLEVLEGGRVDHTGAFVFNLGVAQGASGVVTVDGPDSKLNTGGLIIVGDHGEGHFAVTGGARVTANRLWIAHYSDAQPSDMLVSGSGGPGAPSLLQISGSAYIGGEEAQGSGVSATLTVENGGQVIVGDVLKVWSAGTLDLTDGTINVPNQFVNLSGGTLRGDGTIEGDLTNAGIISPGHSAGVITIDGAYEQDPAGTLKIEIGGTSPTMFDQLEILGDEIILAGTLDVGLLGGFAPHGGDVFQIITAAHPLSGSFTNEILPPLIGALAWNVDYDTLGDRVLLEVVSPYSADFDKDGDVDGDDLTVWRGAYSLGTGADADGDNDTDGRDFFIWQRQYGLGVEPPVDVAAVPEPNSTFLLSTSLITLCGRARLRRRQVV